MKLKVKNITPDTFTGFIIALMNEQGFYEFNVETNKDFYLTDVQRKHIAPSGDINHPQGFTKIWKDNIEEIKTLQFLYKSRDHTKKIEGIFDVENKNFELTDRMGITQERVKEYIDKYFIITDQDKETNKFLSAFPELNIFGIKIKLEELYELLNKGNAKESKTAIDKKQQKEWSKPEMIITTLALIVGLVSIPWWPDLYRNVIGLTVNTSNQKMATTTFNLLDIYETAFTYDILADRQVFFRKHIGSQVYGDGNVQEISSLGDSYILEIDIGNYSILCPQEQTENFEKLYPLLKNKKVRFYGIFTYSNYFGYDGNTLTIDQCSFERT